MPSAPARWPMSGLLTVRFAMSGPYEITAFKQGRYVEYRRDPDYWGKDIPLNRGRYNFDTIRFDIYRDATVTREAFRKGLIDIWTEWDARYWHGAFDTPAYHKGWVKKIRRYQGFSVGIRQGIVLNNRRGKFADRRVRQALTLAVDFEWQNRVLHFGYHTRAHSYWPDTILSATGLPSADELALLWQYYQIPLYSVDLPATVHWDKFGRPDYEPKYQPAFPDGWWYDTEKAARIIGGGD